MRLASLTDEGGHGRTTLGSMKHISMKKATVNNEEVWPLFSASFPRISIGHLFVQTICSGLYKDVHIMNSGENIKT